MVDYVAVDSVRPLYSQTGDSLCLDIAEPPRKRPWLSGGEVVGTNLLFHVITRYIIHEDYAQITGRRLRIISGRGFCGITTIQYQPLLSPLSGRFVFNCAPLQRVELLGVGTLCLVRQFHLGTFFGVATSFDQRYHLDDLGAVWLWRGELSTFVTRFERAGTRVEPVCSRSRGVCAHPVRGVNRLITGEAWRIGPRYVDRAATVPFYFQFDAGYRVLNCADAKPDRKPAYRLCRVQYGL